MTAMLKPGIQRWLEQHCESSPQVAGGVVVAAGALAGEVHTVAEWPPGGALTPPLAAAAQAALQRARPVLLAPTLSVAEARHNRVISLPLRDGDRLLGAVALAVQAEDSTAVEALLRELTQASAGLGASLVPAAVAAPIGVDERRAPAGHGARVGQLQALLLGAPTLAEGALALLTELAPMLGCERASLAVVDGRELALVALSNSAEFKPEQGLLRQIVAAMQEALDQDSPVVCPSAAGEPPRITLAHTDLHAATGHAIGSWPLWPARPAGASVDAASDKAAEPVGALLVERVGTTPLDAEQQSLCAAVAAMLGPLVALRRAAELPWQRRARAACRAGVARLARRGDPWPKLAGALALVLAGTALWLPLPYRIGAPVRVEGAVQRVTPVAVQRDGRYGFEVEARLAAPLHSLRPGLEGVARIDAGRQPLAWQLGHRAVDWLRMAWWSTGF